MYKMSHHRLHHHPDNIQRKKNSLEAWLLWLKSPVTATTQKALQKNLQLQTTTKKKKKRQKLQSADTRCVTTSSKPYSTFSLNQSSALDRVIALRGNKTASHLFSSLSSAKRSEPASSSDANKTKINKSLVRKTATRTQTQRDTHTHTHARTHARRHARTQKHRDSADNCCRLTRLLNFLQGRQKSDIRRCA